MAHDVFISYATEDKPVADAACAALESQRIRCWMAPRDILPGRPYPEAIEEAVTEARLMVVIFSGPAIASPAVRSEIHLAFTRERTIVPFRIQDIPLARGMNYLLGVVHWLDAMTPPLERHLRTLVDRVREHLGPSTPAPTPGPPQPDRSSNPEARTHHNRGVEHYRSKDFAKAVAEFTRAIEIDPAVAWAWNDRGAAHLQHGNLELAIADLNRGIQLDPSQAWAWHTRGSAHFRQGNWDLAIVDYSATIRLDPAIAWAWHDRGAAQLHNGQFAEAIADFTQAILLNPELEWAYRNRAKALEALGNNDAARADMKKADQLKPGHSRDLSDQAAASRTESASAMGVEILYRNRHGRSILMVQTFPRDPDWSSPDYHLRQPDGERRPLRHCLKVFGNRVRPVAEPTRESCIDNAIENILDLKPDVVGLGGVGETAHRIRAALTNRNFTGSIDHWGADVGIDAAEFLRRYDVEPPY